MIYADIIIDISSDKLEISIIISAYIMNLFLFDPLPIYQQEYLRSGHVHP